jgi:hypothetical protein
MEQPNDDLLARYLAEETDETENRAVRGWMNADKGMQSLEQDLRFIATHYQEGMFLS